MDATLPSSSVWGYHECIEDLKQKIMRTSMELDNLRANSSDEIRKSDEKISQLVQIIKALTLERDEARVEMQLLLHQMTAAEQPRSTHQSENYPPLLPPPPPSRHAGGDNNASTSMPEPAAVRLPGSHNQICSDGSSPAESAIDDLPSPGPSNMNVADSSNVLIPSLLALAPAPAGNDMAEAVIGRLAGERALPEKGKLFQAVLDAGPLLNDLFIAGQLPRWRNPPPMLSSNAPLLPPLPAAAASGGGILNIQNDFLNPTLMNLGFQSGVQPDRYIGASH